MKRQIIAMGLISAASTTQAQIPVRTLASPNQEIEGFFASSLAVVPDLTGDFVEELLIGAPNETPPNGQNDAGRAYLHNGATGQLIRAFTSPNQEFDGSFGEGVSALGDVTGDSLSDLAVGAANEQVGNQADAGRVYVFDGGTGSLLRTLVSPSPQFQGAFGREIASVPDITGDGFPEIAVSAPWEGPVSATRNGRVHLYNGSTGSFIRTIVSPIGTNNDEFGTSIVGLPDITGDGRGDIAIGAPFEEGPIDNQLIDSGAVFLVNGSTGQLIRRIDSANREADGWFGFDVDVLMPTEEDTMIRLLVGAPHEETDTSPLDAGRAYVYDASTGDLVFSMQSPSEVAEGNFGFTLGGIPDVTADEAEDILVGSPGERRFSDGVFKGRAHAFERLTGAYLSAVDSPDTESGGEFGSVVGGMRDFSGEGTPELVVGAPTEDPGAVQIDSGRVHIFSSHTLGLDPRIPEFLAID